MEIGLVRQVDIDQEMRESYLSYAMSVIVSRALPDARDGLKPVQAEKKRCTEKMPYAKWLAKRNLKLLF